MLLAVLLLMTLPLVPVDFRLQAGQLCGRESITVFACLDHTPRGATAAAWGAFLLLGAVAATATVAAALAVAAAAAAAAATAAVTPSPLPLCALPLRALLPPALALCALTLALCALLLRPLPLCALPLCALPLRALPFRALPLCALPLRALPLRALPLRALSLLLLLPELCRCGDEYKLGVSRAASLASNKSFVLQWITRDDPYCGTSPPGLIAHAYPA